MATPLAQILDDASSFLRRFIVMSPEQADACALYCALSHVTDAFDYVPYLAITSGTKQSGKTSLRMLLSWLCARPWIISGRPTEAVLFRKIEQDKPSLFIDECDRIFAGKDNDAIYALINSGNRRGETIPRMDKRADGTSSVQDFDIFCPKTLTGIGKNWPDTIVDRCINVRLRRKLPTESVERLRHRVIKPQAEPIHDALAEWASTDGLLDWLSEPLNWPEPPDELSSRAQDGWEPLLAIAEMVRCDWCDRAWNAALALREDIDLSDSDEMRLLVDTKTVVYKLSMPPRISSARMVDGLKRLPESPWRDLDTTTLAVMLRPFDVSPKPMRIEGNPNHRGYKLEWLQDAWDRYLSPEAATPATPATNGLETGG